MPFVEFDIDTSERLERPDEINRPMPDPREHWTLQAQSSSTVQLAASENQLALTNRITYPF